MTSNRLPNPQRRAAAMAALSIELADVVQRMWRLYEQNDALNAEQPAVTQDAFAASLDDWWHAVIDLRDEWKARAGLPPGSAPVPLDLFDPRTDLPDHF